MAGGRDGLAAWGAHGRTAGRRCVVLGRVVERSIAAALRVSRGWRTRRDGVGSVSVASRRRLGVLLRGALLDSSGRHVQRWKVYKARDRRAISFCYPLPRSCLIAAIRVLSPIHTAAIKVVADCLLREACFACLARDRSGGDGGDWLLGSVDVFRGASARFWPADASAVKGSLCSVLDPIRIICRIPLQGEQARSKVLARAAHKLAALHRDAATQLRRWWRREGRRWHGE